MRQSYYFLQDLEDQCKEKLHIGCGQNYLKGYTNLDWTIAFGADVACNLSLGKLPFKDDMFDLIYCSHTLEHLKNWRDIVEEIYRVSKNKARVIIEVPYYHCQNAFYPEHVAFFTAAAFDPWTMNKDNPEKFKWKARFRLLRRQPDKVQLWLAKYIPELVNDISFDLEVIKID